MVDKLPGIPEELSVKTAETASLPQPKLVKSITITDPPKELQKWDLEGQNIYVETEWGQPEPSHRAIRGILHRIKKQKQEFKDLSKPEKLAAVTEYSSLIRKTSSRFKDFFSNFASKRLYLAAQRSR